MQSPHPLAVVDPKVAQALKSPAWFWAEAEHMKTDVKWHPLLASLWKLSPEAAPAILNDEILRGVILAGLPISADRGGKAFNIRCPFESEHTTESSETATQYYPANTGGYPVGRFHCLHAHCSGRSEQDFRRKLGLADTDLAARDFAPIPVDKTVSQSTTAAANNVLLLAQKPPRFTLQPGNEFQQACPAEWIVKGVLPRAAIGVIFGPSGSGKSFLVLGIAAAIARGIEWCGRRVSQGDVIYIAAEGSSGMKKRMRAYSADTGADLGNILVLPASPNFTQRDDVREVLEAIRVTGRIPSLIVVDTLAQVTPGADENAGKDMGKVLEHCRLLHEATGALVLLVHHTGKDSTRGARGWSGLRAACDVEIEVERAGENRSATITKMKDGEDGATFSFRLRTVPLGEDEDGDPTKSCVVDYTGFARVRPERQQKLGRVQQQVFDAIRASLDLPTDTVARTTALDCFLESTEAKIGARDNRKRDFDRAIDDLIERGRIVVEDDRISLPGRGAEKCE